MSESDTSASSIIRQTLHEYEEMRRKLAETERKLNKLARMEVQDRISSAHNRARSHCLHRAQSQTNAGLIQIQKDAGDSSPQPPCQQSVSVPSLNMEDVASIRSELSTVPGSYTGFASRAFPASTPSKQTAAAAPVSDGQLAIEEVCDSDSSGSIQHGSKNSNNNSLKLLRQNQRLLSEVERVVCELQAAKHREGELCLDLENRQSQVSELQEQVEELQAETKAQDKALRSAEQHLSEMQRELCGVQQQLLSCQLQNRDAGRELQEEKRLRKSAEGQRDEAVENFGKTQRSLEELQQHSQEQIRMLQASEDRLRDRFTYTDAEREELLQRVDSLQDTVMTQEAEIERLQTLSSAEQEAKNDMEADILQLRQQLAKLTAKYHKLEEENREVSMLREENASLRSEVEECRDVIVELENMTGHLRRQRLLLQASKLSDMANDSGNFSIHLATNEHAISTPGKELSVSLRSRMETKGENAEDYNTNNNGSTITNILTELRSMLFEMDDEIRILRSRLCSQEENQQMVHDLRTELAVLMDKAIKGEEQMRELEAVVGKLESDKVSLSKKASQLQADLKAREAQILSLDGRLTQRNAHVIELQEDVSRRCQAVSRLEKEVWKKCAAISHLEALLGEKQEEINQNTTDLTEMQHALVLLQDELKTTGQKAKAHQNELQRCKDECNRHCSQLWQCQRDIEMLQAEVERKEHFNQDLEQREQQARMEAADKDKLIGQLEVTLLETKQTMSETIKSGQEALRQMDIKLADSNEQVHQLESALILCRNEIAEHIRCMDKTRQQFDAELGKREQAIARLEGQLQNVHCEVQQRAEDAKHLACELEEQRSLAQHRQSRIAQLERSEDLHKENVKQLEQQLMKEKAQWLMEADELESRLCRQAVDLDAALAKISDQKQTIRELEEEHKQSQSDRLSLEKALHNEKAANQNHTSRIVHLEKDLRDMRVELEQKIEIVADLEDLVRHREADLEQHKVLVEQLDVDKLRMQREIKEQQEMRCRLEESLQQLQFDSKAKEQILSDTRDFLRKTQNELNEKTLESAELQEALNERQKELEGRVLAVQQLEQTIIDTHEEMSQRMQRVDNTLLKYEAEIKERTVQLADLDDRLRQTQNELLETSRQLQHQQQLSQRQQMELHAANSKLEELENASGHQKQQLDEQKQENVEVTQELRLTREQLQTQHVEFLAARRELTAVRRESEHLMRDLEDLSIVQRSKDQEAAKLSEELGCSQARLAQAEAKLSAHVKQMQSDMVEIQNKHQEEMAAVCRSRDEALEQHAEAVKKITQQSQLLAENERLYRQRLDTAHAELEALCHELESRRDLIRSANETIFMKDTEIARLKAHVSRLERSNRPLYPSLQATTPSQVWDGRAYQPVFHSTVMDQNPGCSHHYCQPSSPHSPLTRQDLSQNANLNSSQNANELPMKDTWHDKGMQLDGGDGEYAADQLIFSFEKLAPGQASGSGERTEQLANRTEKREEVEGQRIDAVSAEKKPGVGCGVGEKGEQLSSNVKTGAGNGDETNCLSVSRTTGLSAAQSHSHGAKSSVRKTKSSNRAKKSQQKKLGHSQEEKDYNSNHCEDPDTLVSSCKPDKEIPQPEKQMETLQQKLQANALRQQEIEQQLRLLDGNSAAKEDLISFSAD